MLATNNGAFGCNGLVLCSIDSVAEIAQRRDHLRVEVPVTSR